MKSQKKGLRGGSQPEEEEMKKTSHFSYEFIISNGIEIEIP